MTNQGVNAVWRLWDYSKVGKEPLGWVGGNKAKKPGHCHGELVGLPVRTGENSAGVLAQ